MYICRNLKLTNMPAIPFLEYGSGPVSVILTHGFCEDRRIFEQVLPFLNKEAFTWFLPDLPGFGEAVDNRLLSMSMIGYADYLRDWILDQGETKVILAGHSMGGYAALEFAALYPEMLKGLILIHSQVQPDSSAKRKSRDEHIRFLEKNGLPLYVKKLIPQLYPKAWREQFADVIQTWITRAQAYNTYAVTSALRCMRDRKDHRKTLTELKIPVGIIAGKHDPVVSLEHSLEMAHLAKTTSFHLLENAGHMGMIEDTTAFAKALQQCVEDMVVRS